MRRYWQNDFFAAVMKLVIKTVGILIAALILNSPQLFAQLISNHNPPVYAGIPKTGSLRTLH